MHLKKTKRTRRALKSRMRMRKQGIERLSVTRSGRHIYAQVISADGAKVLAQASTLDETLRSEGACNIELASKVGELVADRAKNIGVMKVAFDRSGFKYHGKIKALAEAARANGMEF
ncbi:MAG: 50S ribosomal protein L18 [Gammaproteobacteria bacterium]|nr:50S ribosomal protein L18 [Gammaproteobacteria bacterium]GIS51583.1 MAG: 50S ribosomal protein L18 [Gammaproteobacteria bacterium]